HDEAHHIVLAFNAAVGGSIRIVESLRDKEANLGISRISGVLNGTCNYILTTMWKKKCSFEQALKEAQDKKYAESEPTLDVDGMDTAHKLAIAASLAFDIVPPIDRVRVKGIRGITLSDMELASQFKCAIKLLGVAEKTDHGIELRVQPCLVAADSI